MGCNDNEMIPDSIRTNIKKLRGQYQESSFD